MKKIFIPIQALAMTLKQVFIASKATSTAAGLPGIASKLLRVAGWASSALAVYEAASYGYKMLGFGSDSSEIEGTILNPPVIMTPLLMHADDMQKRDQVAIARSFLYTQINAGISALDLVLSALLLNYISRTDRIELPSVVDLDVPLRILTRVSVGLGMSESEVSKVIDALKSHAKEKSKGGESKDGEDSEFFGDETDPEVFIYMYSLIIADLSKVSDVRMAVDCIASNIETRSFQLNQEDFMSYLGTDQFSADIREGLRLSTRMLSVSPGTLFMKKMPVNTLERNIVSMVSLAKSDRRILAACISYITISIR